MESAYHNMTQEIIIRHHDKIKKFCAPLFEGFNLNSFWHVKVLTNSFCSFISSHAEWSEYFEDEKLYLKYPYFKHPNCLAEGIYLQNYRQSENANLQKVNDASIRFGCPQNLVLRFCHRTSEGIEEWGFASPISSEAQISIFLNELPLLRLFIKKFKKENHFLFSKMHELQFDVSNLVGDHFFEKDEPKTPLIKKKQAILEKLGIDTQMYLTKREREIVELLLNGFSANKIASQIHLSKRTVEHHIERIKEKLGSYSKSDLIQKAQELMQLGVLI